MPTDNGLRLNDYQGIHNARRNPIEAGRNQPIEIAEGEPLRRFSSQHIFAMDPGSAPQRVGEAHSADQLPDFERHLRSAAASSRLPSPEQDLLRAIFGNVTEPILVIVENKHQRSSPARAERDNALRILRSRPDQICDPPARQSRLAGTDRLFAQTPPCTMFTWKGTWLRS